MSDHRRIMQTLIISNLALRFGFQVWRATFNNFAVEVIGVGPTDIGWIQALREVPGLMGFTLGLLALFLSEVRIMAFSIILLGAGLFLTGQANNTPLLLASTVVMSFGFHYFYPSNNAVVLMAVSKKDTLTGDEEESESFEGCEVASSEGSGLACMKGKRHSATCVSEG